MRMGKPMYRPCEVDYWYYWIDGEQGYPSGDVLARTRIGAKREIRTKHPGCAIDHVLHQSTYYGTREAI